MIVAELIKMLEDVKDKSQRVVVNGYEGGYEDASKILTIELVLDVHTESWYGPHDTPEHITENQEIGRDIINAILIR